jgi:hypothetical protein
MWSPRNTQTRSEFLEQHRGDSFKPVLRMPVKTSLVIFGVLATLIIIGLLLVIATGASAVTVTPASPRLQAWADRAFVPTVRGRVAWTTDTAGCARDACAAPGVVMLDPVDMTLGEERAAWLHELGHQFDYSVMTGDDRGAFRAITHDRRSWRHGPNSPHEQFAVAYQQCAQHHRIARQLPVPGDYRWTPTPGEHARACALIRRVARRS